MLTYFQSRLGSFCLVVFLFSLVAVLATPSAFGLGKGKDPSPNVDCISGNIDSSFGGSLRIGGNFNVGGGGFNLGSDGVSGKIEEELVIGCRTCFAPSGSSYYLPDSVLLSSVGNIQIALPNFTVAGGFTQAGKNQVRNRCEAMPGHTYREIGIPGRPGPSPLCTPPITQEVCAVAAGAGIGAALYYLGAACAGTGLGAAVCGGTAILLAQQCSNFPSGRNDFR